jgi:hypothetical protein
MLTDNDITLVVFTCQGREHLLHQSFESFKKKSDYVFSKIVLAIDGQIAPSAIETVHPEVIVQSFERRGYVHNMITALKQVDTDYFFWLEDDFLFHNSVPVKYMLETMKQNTDWAGIFLSRTVPLNESEKQKHLFADFYVPHFGYSASPTLCNTKYLKEAVNALIKFPKSEQSALYSFETFFDDYFKQNHLQYALLDPGNELQVSHQGQLESTAREYIMINSIDTNESLIEKKYISGFGAEKKISFKNKAGLFLKLWLATAALGFRLWSAREAYDFAFRVYLASLKKFKY